MNDVEDQQRHRDWEMDAEKLFPADVFCEVLPPTAERVFCDAKDEYGKLSRYKLLQERGEDLREFIATALKQAYEQGREDGIKNKCKLIADCKEQWIERCAEIAEKCIENHPVDYCECCGENIAEAIRKEAGE